MCGITAIFNLNGEPASQEIVNKMTRAIAHRGPDNEGFFLHDNFAMGHRRLSILDVSEKGAQPMHSQNGEWVIGFNGCIYNYKEIRNELFALGHQFRSESDTEVISEGLAEWGEEVFRKFNGMFAVVAWNKKTKTLFLSRDRFGIKPLYYWFNGKTILVASEIKSFLAHPGFSVQLNHHALNEYFTFQNLFTFRTLFDGVVMLPPANTVRISGDETSFIKHNSWWDYDFSNPDEKISFEDATEETKRLMKIAVERQMISDVPVGSYLSGGMDSASITAIASKHVPRMTTFTAGFDMSEVTGVEANYDERRDAELTANFYKTEHYEQVINAGDLAWSLPRVVWHLEDLRVGMSYPNYYISRLASKFVKVCLQGTGGDELYGGYPWRYYRVSKSLDQSSFFSNYYSYWQRLVSDESKSELFHAGVVSKMDLNEPRQIFERVFTFNKKLRYSRPEEHIANSLYFEIKTFLPGLLLVGDKLSMANGLEERFPFLDNDLVEFAQRVPVKHKLGNFEQMKRVDENVTHKNAYTEFNDGKNVLRKAMLEFLPESVINRKKQGFSAPDESWYRGENARYVQELLLDKKARYAEFIDPKFVAKIVDEHLHKKMNHRLLIWSLMNFEWWCRIFIHNEKFQ
ncbi:MAG: asparagine synthase (glutamine-hydrolyzing) [Bacteroidetes bacterium]|nr:asparagine synthase (glutamine-hydrolyzing) [Bacteroidota bacterium]